VAALRLYLAAFAGWGLAWCGAWEIARAVGPRGEPGETLWWIGVKLLVWVAPALWLARRDGLGLGFARPRWAVVAVWAAGVVVALAVRATWFGTRWVPPSLELSLFNALVVSPLVEELVFRGYLMPRLARAWTPHTANLAAAFAFAAAHLPGRIYQGRPVELLDLLVYVALGLLFGLAALRSRSTWGAVVLHVVNNVGSLGAR